MIMSSIFDRTGGFDIKKSLERIRKTASRAEREQRRIASGQPCLRRELKEEQRQNMWTRMKAKMARMERRSSVDGGVRAFVVHFERL
jgi:hypothetical protein